MSRWWRWRISWLALLGVALLGLTGSAGARVAASPVIAAAGDIACAPGQAVTATACHQQAVSNLLSGATAVLTLGDNQYENGEYNAFLQSYHPTWGRFKPITYPTAGNHEYHIAGATGHFQYFGAAAGPPGKGYYSVQLGGWLLLALNTNCSGVMGGCGAGSAQEQWLRAELAAHPTTCTLAYFHHSRFSSGFHGSLTRAAAFWQALYERSADVVLSGHDHHYERFAPQSPNGTADARGIREFVVGTGGKSHSVINTPIANSEVRNGDTFGVLKLTLNPTSYAWQFTPDTQGGFTDSGSAACVTGGGPGNQAPSVSAGPDQAITLPANATLNGTVSDDGLPNPPGTLTTTWSKTSGPGTVTFGNASAVDTTATFSQAGTYVLRLTASDSALSAFDELTVTVSGAGQSPSRLYFSLLDPATVGGLAAENEDIVFFNGNAFSLAFDGSDVGITALRIDAFSFLDATRLLLSFDAPGAVPGIAGTTDDADVVLFTASSLGSTTAGTFSLYLDGSDVGLTSNGEDVDAVERLPNGRILISTVNTVSVPGAAGEDEDLLEFLPTQLGPTTAGTFSLYFEGSDVALTVVGEDVDAAAVDPAGKLYLSTFNNFSVPGVSGADEDVFVFTPSSLGATTAGSFSPTLYFDGSTHGLAANDVFAIDLP